MKKLLAYLNRKFTLWRMRPARSILNEEFSNGRLNSKQLHKIDAEILRKCGFKYVTLAAIAATALALTTTGCAQMKSQISATQTHVSLAVLALSQDPANDKLTVNGAVGAFVFQRDGSQNQPPTPLTAAQVAAIQADPYAGPIYALAGDKSAINMSWGGTQLQFTLTRTVTTPTNAPAAKP